jgi:hypothetical protein
MRQDTAMKLLRVFAKGALRLAVAAAVFAWLATELLWRPRQRGSRVRGWGVRRHEGMARSRGLGYARGDDKRMKM